MDDFYLIRKFAICFFSALLDATYPDPTCDEAILVLEEKFTFFYHLIMKAGSNHLLL